MMQYLALNSWHHIFDLHTTQLRIACIAFVSADVSCQLSQLTHVWVTLQKAFLQIPSHYLIELPPQWALGNRQQKRWSSSSAMTHRSVFRKLTGKLLLLILQLMIMLLIVLPHMWPYYSSRYSSFF